MFARSFIPVLHVGAEPRLEPGRGLGDHKGSRERGRRQGGEGVQGGDSIDASLALSFGLKNHFSFGLKFPTL